MAIQNRFQTVQQVIASFPYTDVAEGTGRITYYGTTSKNTSTLAYYMAQNQAYSTEITTGAVADGVVTPAAKVLDLDFDVRFNLPQRVTGLVRLNIPVALFRSTGTGGPSVYVSAKVRKWDGSTETELANGTSETYTNSAASTTIAKMFNFTVDCSAGFNFKSGETLRITLEVWNENTGSSAANVYIGHDPQNRTGSGFSSVADSVTIMTFDVPFKLKNV
jgi:hypothetical protein